MKEHAKIHNVIKQLSEKNYVDNFQRTKDNDLVIPLVCSNLSDLIQPYSINDSYLVKPEVYDAILQTATHIPANENLLIVIDSTNPFTAEDQRKAALAFKHGFLMSSMRYSDNKRKLLHKSNWILTMFFIALMIIAVLEYLLTFDFDNHLYETFAMVFSEVFFIVLWVLGWSYCDIIFFDKTALDREVASRFQVYKARLLFKKIKDLSKAKVIVEDDQNDFNTAIKTYNEMTKKDSKTTKIFNIEDEIEPNENNETN